MDKNEFLDILFAGAWISAFVNIPVSAIVFALIKLFSLDDSVLAVLLIICPVVMYNVCKYLYYRKYGK